MIEIILNKYRVDGPIDSPVRFLTIEDGGRNFKDPKEVADYFNRSNEEFVWIPKESDKLLGRVDGGVKEVGEYIAKIMAKLLTELNVQEADWRIYLRDRLYRQYEHNIKFYPFGRKDVNFFPTWLTDELGISSSEYTDQAKKHRTPIFADLFTSQPAKVNIILAAEDEWWNVFKLIHPNLHIVDQGNYIKCAHSGDEGDKLVYIYFSIFAHIPGSKDVRAETVAELAARELGRQEFRFD